MSQTTDYNIWQQELGEAGFQSNASELHGIVTGYLCSGAGLSLERLSDLLQQPMTPPAQTSILRMVRDAQVGLVDEYLGFEPLLPGEDIALSERVRGLSAWCGGFLQGFGGAGQFSEADLPESVREVLPDLLQIASIRDEVPEDDANDADLTEIAEYVRVAVMTVFVECSRRAEGASDAGRRVDDSDDHGGWIH